MTVRISQVGVNTGLISNVASPFGGVKESGQGREVSFPTGKAIAGFFPHAWQKFLTRLATRAPNWELKNFLR
jgi:hypothetical protein